MSKDCGCSGGQQQQEKKAGSGLIQCESMQEFDNVLASTKQLVVVDFYTTWCGPCKTIAPKVQQLAGKMSNVVFMKVDAEAVEDLAAREKVNRYPSFIFYRNKRRIDRMEGSNFDNLRALIEKHA